MDSFSLLTVPIEASTSCEIAAISLELIVILLFSSSSVKSSRRSIMQVNFEDDNSDSDVLSKVNNVLRIDGGLSVTVLSSLMLQ